ncbi:MAG: hypothetical protein M9887_00925 [Chitinophagales bacterium]|nr:hypothetical protein [Chitinophagales bacterium]
MNNRMVSILQLVSAIGITVFWLVFFLVGFENPNYPSYYTYFEHSFPLPDTFLVIMLMAAFFNRTNYRWKKFTNIAAGAMIFLSLCDFSFNILNGMYTIGIVDAILNVFINIWCFIFGIIQIIAAEKVSRNSIHW